MRLFDLPRPSQMLQGLGARETTLTGAGTRHCDAAGAKPLTFRVRVFQSETVPQRGGDRGFDKFRCRVWLATAVVGWVFGTVV